MLLLAVAAPPPQLEIIYDSIPDPDVARRVRGLDASEYLIIYQGCDPQSMSSGSIDIDAVLAEIDRKLKGRSIVWGMLDFENPFTANLQAGVDSPKYQSTVQSMVSTMRAVRGRYPNIRWTYYGTPFMSYWLTDKNWATASAEAKKELLDKTYKIYSPIVAEQDWVSPSIYPIYDPAIFDPKSPAAVREGGRAWRSSQVGIAKILAAGKPVIPTISPFWQPNGVANAGRTVPQDQFVEDQIAPAVAAGANGVAIWTGIEYSVDLAIGGTAKYPQQEENFGTRVWRDAFIRDYLDNRPPAQWDDPQLRATLIRKVSTSIFDAIRWIRISQLPPSSSKNEDPK